MKVGRKKTNLMFIGDGKGKTVITGGKSVSNSITTFHTASFGNFLFPPSYLIIVCTFFQKKNIYILF